MPPPPPVPATPPRSDDGTRWRRLNELVHGALALPAAERASYLRVACPDRALRREAAELVEIDEGQLARWNRPAARLLVAPAAAPLERVGPYRLDRVLGSGGTGTVYLGVRDDREFDHRVAIKVLKRGLDTDEILERFRRERQILARLDHPGIAELHGGGTTSDHRPYFVMELVDGLPIDRYCDRHRLGPDARLRLVLKVCDAVQVAHQSLVVHRDLKPSNILVDAHGEPKLLDFGIAKLLDPAAAETCTATGWRMMTPEYASPEQVRGEPIGAASDVYSLGVLLYELLVGVRPYDVPRGPAAAVQRAVCEISPAKPSSRFEDSKADEPCRAAAARARQRGATVAGLRRRLRGDLDTIVLRALAKEPRRRYATVERLADDLERHLTGRPVRARGDSASYRLGKLLRRRWRGVAVTAAALAALGVGVVDRLEHQRRVELERDRAQRVTELLVELFEAADPESGSAPGLGPDPTAREVLDRGLARIRGGLDDEPEVRAPLLSAMGRVYGHLGLLDRALPLATEALALHRRLDDRAAVATDLASLGELEFLLGRYAAAEDHQRAALELRTELLGAQHPLTIETTGALAMALWRQDDLEAAETLMRGVVDRQRRRLGGTLALTPSLNQLAVVLQEQGDLAAAEALFDEGLAIKRRVLGAGHPRLARELNNLGVLHLEAGDLDRAAHRLNRSLELVRAAYGEEHPRVASTLGTLGHVAEARDDWSAARRLFLEALAVRRATMPADSPAIAELWMRLARAEYALGDRAAAGRLVSDALAVFERHEHPAAEIARHLLATLEPPAAAETRAGDDG